MARDLVRIAARDAGSIAGPAVIATVVVSGSVFIAICCAFIWGCHRKRNPKPPKPVPENANVVPLGQPRRDTQRNEQPVHRPRGSEEEDIELPDYTEAQKNPPPVYDHLYPGDEAAHQEEGAGDVEARPERWA